MEFSHIPVLLNEVIEALAPERGGIYVDCTAGGGGHSSEIAKRLPEGSRLICLHVNDNHAGGDEHLLPFFGTINWADAMKGLGEIDFGYCFNYECRVLRLPGDVREHIGRHAVALGHKLVEMMG